jgi:hypothetical protein
MNWGIEPGEYEVFVGPNSQDLTAAEFELAGSSARL